MVGRILGWMVDGLMTSVLQLVCVQQDPSVVFFILVVVETVCSWSAVSGFVTTCRDGWLTSWPHAIPV